MEEHQVMDWVQVLTLIIPFVLGFVTIFGTIIAGFRLIYNEIKNYRADTKTEINEIKNEIKQNREEFREDMKKQAERSDKLSERSDKLYEIIIQLLRKKSA